MRLSARLLPPLAIVFAQACGSLAGSSPGSSSALPSSLPSPHSSTPAPSASATATNVTITQGEDGKTVTVHVGDELQIALGEQYHWELDRPDGVVLVQPFQTYLLRQGTQALWLARSVGRSMVNATGRAECGSTQSCPPSPITFTATVIVVP